MTARPSGSVATPTLESLLKESFSANEKIRSYAQVQELATAKPLGDIASHPLIFPVF